MSFHIDASPVRVRTSEKPEERTRIKIYVSGQENPLIICTPNHGESGRPFLELGQAKIEESEQLESLLETIVKTVQTWIADKDLRERK